MKIKNSRRGAFFNLRALVASVLCLAAGMLTLFAFSSAAGEPDHKTQRTSLNRWLTRLATTIGIESNSHRVGGRDAAAVSGAAPVHKNPVEQPQPTSRPPSGVTYTP